MSNEEYEIQPRKKKKNSGFVIGSIVGAVIATAAILFVLFATGVIGTKDNTPSVEGKNGNTEISETAEKDNFSSAIQPSADNQSSANKKYREFTLENIPFYYESRTERTTVTVQVPYLEEFEKLGVDLDLLEVNKGKDFYTNIRNDSCLYVLEIRLIAGDGDGIGLGIAYSDSSYTYDKIIGISMDTDNINGKWADAQYIGSVDKAVWSEVGGEINGEKILISGYTSSGYSINYGTFYDNNGNVISWEEYNQELWRLSDEAEAKLYESYDLPTE